MSGAAQAAALADLDLDPGRIDLATRTIDPVFLNSPQFADGQLSAALGREVTVKVETCNPLHSFKGRGAEFFAERMPRGRRVVCASSGNFGQAMAYACGKRGIPVEVYAPAGVNPVKADRMRALGAEVIVVDGDGWDAATTARARAEADPDADYIVDGHEAAIAEGAGTIGVELLRSGPFDAVAVPVGDGALINGVGRWFKEHAPETRIVGVCAEGAPSMVDSWRAGSPMPTESYDTIAEGIAIRAPRPASVRRMQALVDDMVLVPDRTLIDMITLAAETIGVLLEPAGAAGLAAISRGEVPGERVATILTGGNLHPDLRRTLISRERTG